MGGKMTQTITTNSKYSSTNSITDIKTQASAGFKLVADVGYSNDYSKSKFNEFNDSSHTDNIKVWGGIFPENGKFPAWAQSV